MEQSGGRVQTSPPRLPSFNRIALQESDDSLNIIESISERTTALSVAELALILNISKRTIYEHIDENRLPCIRFGSTIRLCPEQTAQWITDRAA
jgi:excisionase family DNA binding protein